MAVEAPLEDAAARLSASALMRASGRRLGLAAPPPPDAADALALALCHLHRAPLAARVARALAAGARA